MLTSIKDSQSNAPVERVHQVLNYMFLTKDLNSQTFDYIGPWGEIPSSIAWTVRAPHHTTFDKNPAQLVFGRDMIFNLYTVIDWKAITLRKQKQVDRDNPRENFKRVNYDYAEQDIVYTIPDGIQGKLDYREKGPCTVTQVFTNSTVQIQRYNVNERINM